MEAGFRFVFLILAAALGVVLTGGLFSLSKVPLVKVTGGISLLLESVDGLSFVRSASDMVDSSSVYQLRVYS